MRTSSHLVQQELYDLTWSLRNKLDVRYDGRGIAFALHFQERSSDKSISWSTANSQRAGLQVNVVMETAPWSDLLGVVMEKAPRRDVLGVVMETAPLRDLLCVLMETAPQRDLLDVVMETAPRRDLLGVVCLISCDETE
ncbi:hypothetical protein B0O80DRAFT_450081 [Mortierella sp. GBAus27b]|nr:hypothetical protein B0O80DRAFT_450081 [Mortierella sp. GBAus27b]